jgi:hypothetical protein
MALSMVLSSASLPAAIAPFDTLLNLLKTTANKVGSICKSIPLLRRMLWWVSQHRVEHRMWLVH